MAKIIHQSALSLTLGLLCLAGCQAPGGPLADVRTASVSTEPLKAFRQAWGLPQAVIQPPRDALVRMPAFRVAANDSLWGSEVAVANATNDQELPSVAYNTSAKNYMTVWQDSRNTTDGSNTDIYAQLVSNNGLNTGSVLVVSNAAGLQMGPRIVYNTTGNEYLIAWTDARSGNADVYTQRVTAAGALTGSATVVATGTGNQILNAIAYHAAQNQYLVTWTDDTTGSNVLNGARVTAANAKTGSDIAISTTAGALGNGSVTVNTASGDYLVAWPDARTAAPGVYLQKITSAGVLSGTAAAIASGAAYEFYSPRVIYNTFTPGYMLVYDRRTTASGEADAIGQRLTTAAAANGAAFALTASTGVQMTPDVSFNNADGNYLVCWADGRAGANDLDIYGKVYKPDGTVYTAEYAVAAATNVQAMPTVTFDSTRKQFLFVWQDARNYATAGYEIYGQRAATAPLTATEIMDETLETFNNIAPGTSGGANGARSQLENAISKILADKPDNAIGHLTNFLNSLPGLQSNGVITASERVVLENMANEAIAQINAGNY